MEGVLRHVRMVLIDEEKKLIKLSLVDFVQSVTGKDTKRANVMINDSRNNVHTREKSSRLLHTKHKFPGQGQKNTYVVNIDEAIEYMDCLPNKHTDDIKQQIRKILLRVFAGDQSLHDEIDRNAQDTGVVTGLAKEFVQKTVPNAVVRGEDNVFKKRRLMIELEEREFALKEQIFALKEREARLPLQLANERYETCVKLMTDREGISGANLLQLKDIAQREINMVMKRGNVDAPQQTCVRDTPGRIAANQSEGSNDTMTYFYQPQMQRRSKLPWTAPGCRR